jgi:hypothetical protein
MAPPSRPAPSWVLRWLPRRPPEHPNREPGPPTASHREAGGWSVTQPGVATATYWSMGVRGTGAEDTAGAAVPSRTFGIDKVIATEAKHSAAATTQAQW